MPAITNSPDILTVLRRLFKHNADVVFLNMTLRAEDSDIRVALVFCDGLIERRQIDQTVLPQLEQITIEQLQAGQLRNVLFQPVELDKSALLDAVFSGQLLLLFENHHAIYSLDIANPPNRNTEESNTEVSVKGPRDGFTEQLTTNIALIRKRLKTNTLYSELFVIGRRSRTQVALLYISDIANDGIIRKVQSRLSKIDVDTLISSEDLIEYISDSPFSPIPLVDYNGRPDFVVESLIRGRFALIVDGTPMALIAPATLSSLLKTPEDFHQPYYFVFLESLLRFVGLGISVLLPGFYIALATFQLDQIPFPFLSTISNARKGLPLPAAFEGFMMQIVFELFREAGIRLPKGVGQTVTVVGGLFIGQAAIDAGITSPTMLVVTSISIVAAYTLVNQSLGGIVTLARLYILAVSSFFGLYGFFLSAFSLLVFLAGLESYGVPYLAPLSPPSRKDMLMALFSKPRRMNVERPVIYRTKDRDRRDEPE